MKKLLLVLCCVALSGIVQADLLVNGDFSSPGTGSAGQFGSVTINNWTTWGTSGWYANDIDSQMSAKIWATDTGIYQDWSATAGQSYDLTVQGYQTTGEQLTGDRVGYLTVEWYESGGAKIGSSLVVDTISAADSDNAWVSLSGTATAPANTAYGRTVLGVSDTTSGSGAVFFDNATVNAVVPEPAALSMIGLGFFALMRFRKKVRA